MVVPASGRQHGATIARLETQVSGLESGQGDIKRTVLDLDSKIDQSIAALANRVENSLNTLSNKIEARNTTQWPVLFSGFGIVITVLTLVGGMAYLPIQRDTARLDSAVAAILDKGVFQNVYGDDRKRVQENLDRLRTDLSTRITLPRYNADQERITHALDEMRSRFATKPEMEAIFRERQRQVDYDSTQIENIRVRTYDHFGRISKTEQAVVDLERRFDNISRRVIELNNRTMGVQRPPN